MPGPATLLWAPLSAGGTGAGRADEHPAPKMASHTARVADVLARWREAEREYLAADPRGEDAVRLGEEVARLREEYQALMLNGATDPPR